MHSLITFAANTLVTGIGAAGGFQAALRAAQNLHPAPFPHQFSALLDGGLRWQYLEPGAIAGMLGITAGMSVLDVGAGTGIFTVEAARMVGDQGTVHAVELQEPLLRKVEARCHSAGVRHLVHLHHGGVYDLPFIDDSIDLALLVSTFGEIADKPAALTELRRVLKPDSRLGVTEEMLFPGYVGAGSARRWLEEAGFQWLAKSGSPWCYTSVFLNKK